jgi:hypothetical protein
MAWLKPPTAKRQEWNTPVAKCNRDDDRDALRSLYKKTRWLRFAASVKTCNPQCQRTVNGEQCHQASKIVHHLVSPKVRPELFLDWQYVVAICAEHHETSTGENLNSPHTYAITRGILGASVDPNEVIAKLANPYLKNLSPTVSHTQKTSE